MAGSVWLPAVVVLTLNSSVLGATACADATVCAGAAVCACAEGVICAGAAACVCRAAGVCVGAYAEGVEKEGDDPSATAVDAVSPPPPQALSQSAASTLANAWRQLCSECRMRAYTESLSAAIAAIVLIKISCRFSN